MKNIVLRPNPIEFGMVEALKKKYSNTEYIKFKKSAKRNFDKLLDDIKSKMIDCHTHAELCDGEEIVYKEADVVRIINAIISKNTYVGKCDCGHKTEDGKDLHCFTID